MIAGCEEVLRRGEAENCVNNKTFLINSIFRIKAAPHQTLYLIAASRPGAHGKGSREKMQMQSKDKEKHKHKEEGSIDTNGISH